MIKVKYIYFIVMVVLAFTASKSLAQNMMENKIEIQDSRY